MNKFLVSAALAALACSLPVAAADALTLKNEVFKEVTSKDASGKTRRERVPAEKATPGTEVIYVITYQNTGKQAANKVVVSNPVPKELEYKGGTASGKGAKFEVSVDGGATYGALDRLEVTGADGRKRRARPADVTHLRWTLGAPVAPGKQGQLSYHAVLK